MGAMLCTQIVKYSPVPYQSGMQLLIYGSCDPKDRISPRRTARSSPTVGNMVVVLAHVQREEPLVPMSGIVKGSSGQCGERNHL